MHGGKGGMEGRKDGQEEINYKSRFFFSKVLRSLIDKEAKKIDSVCLDGPSNTQQTVFFLSRIYSIAR